jgi:hypothetical protein
MDTSVLAFSISITVEGDSVSSIRFRHKTGMKDRTMSKHWISAPLTGCWDFAELFILSAAFIIEIYCLNAKKGCGPQIMESLYISLTHMLKPVTNKRFPKVLRKRLLIWIK